VRSGGSSNRERAGRRETAASRQGVLSGIVVGDGESPLHGEGPDGSTQPAKETRAGHAGSGKHVPTSLRGIANRARESKHHRFRNLFGEVNVELLMHCWHDLNKDAASGVDGLTAETYAATWKEHHRSGRAREGGALPGQAGPARLHPQRERKTATAGHPGPGRQARAVWPAPSC
jgi:hypothetical protein